MKRSVALMVTGILSLTLFAARPTDASAQGIEKGLTDYGLPVMVLGVLIEGLDKRGREQNILLKSSEAVAASAATIELLKRAFPERRPNGKNTRSFASGHAAGAFALATVMGHEKPKQRWLWYGLATAIAWSRVDLRAHRTDDVLIGAAVGYGFGRGAVLLNDSRNNHLGFLLFRKSW